MQTRYVNTASTAGGDGTTNNTSGSTRAFASLGEALSGYHGTTLSDSLRIYCSGTAADTDSSLDHTAWEIYTSPTNYIEVIGDNTTGKWNTSAYRIELTNNSNYNQYAAHVRLYNLQVMVKVTDGSTYSCYRLSTANNDVSGGAPYFIIKNCIARKDPTSTSGNITGYINSVCASGSTAGPLYIINCLAYDCDSGSGQFNTDGSAWANANIFHYNCTAADGLYGWVDCANATNCIGAYNSYDWISGGTDYNASTDGTRSGSHNRDGSIAFVDRSNDDYHLASTDTVCIGYGQSDPSSGVYSDDIDGQTRSGSWDIGADEYVAAVLEQYSFLWRNDDGSETTATSAASQGSNP